MKKNTLLISAILIIATSFFVIDANKNVAQSQIEIDSETVVQKNLDLHNEANHSDKANKKTSPGKLITLDDKVIEVKKEEAKNKETEKEKKKDDKNDRKDNEKATKDKEKNKAKKKTKKENKSVDFKVENQSGNFMTKIDLNIRKGPSTSYGAVGYIKPYEKVVVSGKTTHEGSTWYKVIYKNFDGWASAAYLEPYQKDSKPKTSTENKTSNNSKGETFENTTVSNYKENHIYFNGKSVPYKNIGNSDGSDGTKSQAQKVIDGGVYAATWGGASTFSGTDGLNTHFIGHNPGQFSGMHTADTYIITDNKGTPFTYKKTALYVVDEYGKRTSDGADMWGRITGTGGGERIVLQSTKKDPLKYIVEAELVN